MHVSLAASERDLTKELARLGKILQDMPQTSASRYALAEIVLIRATALFEHNLATVAYKLACGARFDSGAGDIILAPARSFVSARRTMLNKNGALPSPRPNLSWTRAKHIAESVEGVIGTDSHYLRICRRHGSLIAEMFDVRNHAAHRNQSSKRKYMMHVRAVYGHERRMEVGRFLLSTNLLRVSRIDAYFQFMKIIVRDIKAG